MQWCAFVCHYKIPLELVYKLTNLFQANLLISGNASANTQSLPNNAQTSSNLGSSSSASQLEISSGTQQQPNSVLRVIVDNLIYPVTLDILYSV
jgi:hypothetical protein